MTLDVDMAQSNTKKTKKEIYETCISVIIIVSIIVVIIIIIIIISKLC